VNDIIAFIELLKASPLFALCKALLLFIIGFIIARLISSAVVRVAKHKMTAHGQLFLKRSIFYSILVLVTVSALDNIGIDLSILLGAAGIFTVALGFASQTSASNLISGLFLMIERPFSITDVIKVNDITGEVISIDLLSVKLRTFDNLFVRIPNESMIKSAVTTLTKYPIRRADLKIGIAYKEDIEKVRKILIDLASKNLICLEEPAPVFILTGFGSSSIDIQFSVWSRRENFLALKNSMYTEIKIAFDQQGIEIPFPHVSLYAGAATAPFPLSTMVSGDNKPLNTHVAENNAAEKNDDEQKI
jgi:small-conductance mechanosensitive channel